MIASYNAWDVTSAELYGFEDKGPPEELEEPLYCGGWEEEIAGQPVRRIVLAACGLVLALPPLPIAPRKLGQPIDGSKEVWKPG